MYIYTLRIYIYLHINMDGQRLSNWWILWLTLLILLVYVPPWSPWSWTSYTECILVNQRSVRIWDTTKNLVHSPSISVPIPSMLTSLSGLEPLDYISVGIECAMRQLLLGIFVGIIWDCWWKNCQPGWVGYVMRCGRTLEFYGILVSLLHILRGLANPWWW